MSEPIETNGLGEKQQQKNVCSTTPSDLSTFLQQNLGYSQYSTALQCLYRAPTQDTYNAHLELMHRNSRKGNGG